MEKPKYPMRINKYLAEEKHSTRRGADELIKAGKVFINGRLAVLGDKVAESDRVEVRYRGKLKPFVYLAYHKPRGVVTHSAGEGEREIGNMIDVEDVFPIGRLDKDSRGLIILTNDGRVTERLLGPDKKHEKEYEVRTKMKLRPNFKARMEAGVQIEREKTAPAKVNVTGERTFKVVLTEGKKHQIRRMCVALFNEVEDLKRVRVANIELGKLPEGSYRKIEGKELEDFLKIIGLA